MILLFDNTFDGFLTAVFDVYALKIADPLFYSQENYQPKLFEEVITVSFEEQKANRVRKKLEEILSKKGVNQLWKATLSEYDDVYQVLFSILSKTFQQQRNILTNYGDKDVLRLRNIIKEIGRERHRMTAFVRFEQTTNDIYTSIIEPDFNVLPLLVLHFKQRYADQKWLIFDQKRNYGIYYDLQQVLPVEPMKGEQNTLATTTIEWSEEEKHFQNLWKIYFKSTTIESRKNNKLHLQYVPRRYWKYLSEKKPMLK